MNREFFILLVFVLSLSCNHQESDSDVFNFLNIKIEKNISYEIQKHSGLDLAVFLKIKFHNNSELDSFINSNNLLFSNHNSIPSVFLSNKEKWWTIENNKLYFYEYEDSHVKKQALVDRHNLVLYLFAIK